MSLGDLKLGEDLVVGPIDNDKPTRCGIIVIPASITALLAESRNKEVCEGTGQPCRDEIPQVQCQVNQIERVGGMIWGILELHIKAKISEVLSERFVACATEPLLFP